MSPAFPAGVKILKSLSLPLALGVEAVDSVLLLIAAPPVLPAHAVPVNNKKPDYQN